MRILVVDDIPINCTAIENILSFTGHEVISANSGKEALAIIEQDPVQLLIVDWMMPQMTGIELVKRIRKTFTDPYRYIIMLTARDSQEDILIGLQAGVDDYMARPYSPRELEARISIGERIISLETTLRNNAMKVEHAKQEWEATTDSIAQLICLVNEEGHVLRANATVETWGLAWANEVNGTSLQQLLQPVYPNFAAQLKAIWPKAKKQLDSGLEFEYEGMDEQRGHFFHTQYDPIDPYGEINIQTESFAAVSIHDITERKQLEIQLREAKQQIEIEHQKSEDLLLNILPKSIAERLKSGEATIAEHFEDVSVLFADIVGFTLLANTTPPKRLIEMLNELFSLFDGITEDYGLEKIKTIGDSYMAVSGLPTPKNNHAQSIADAAIAMQKVINNFNRQYNQTLNIRVGIDSGPVVAGVIGRKKFIYDLWGNTVNTASRMESHGISGQIQVTEATHALLKNLYVFERRGPIEVKGKGMTLTYLLMGKNSASV